jgi:hypothetical protein
MRTPNEEDLTFVSRPAYFADRNWLRVRGVTARFESATIARLLRDFVRCGGETLRTTVAAFVLHNSADVHGYGGYSVWRPSREPTGTAGPEDRWSMRVTKATVVLFSLVLAGPVLAKDHETLARFAGGIGIIPVSSAAGVANLDGTFPDVNRNVVRGINPSGQPWRIAALNAVVDTDGAVRVRGRGLLLAGGNSIGRTANVSVFASLICGTSAPFDVHSTVGAAVLLAANGDFRIQDTLDSVPATCASPALLIRATNGTWLAAGIERLDDDDE